MEYFSPIEGTVILKIYYFKNHNSKKVNFNQTLSYVKTYEMNVAEICVTDRPMF